MLLVTATAADRALADEVDVCIAAHADSQRERLAGHLRASRERAVTCARTGCPATLRAECGGWVGELDTLIPSVVVRARGPDGADLRDVRVSVDGAPLLESLGGEAVAVDPGNHRLRYEWQSGRQVKEESVQIREGERARRLEISFDAPVQAHPVSSAAAPKRADGRPVPAGVFVLGGVGLIAIAGFAGFGLAGHAQESDLREAKCKPNCSKDDTDAIMFKYIAADVALGVGVIALGVATVLFLRRPSAPPAAPLAVRFGRGAVVPF